MPTQSGRSNGVTRLKPNTPMLLYSNYVFLAALIILVLATGCDRLPGKPIQKSAGSLPLK